MIFKNKRELDTHWQAIFGLGENPASYLLQHTPGNGGRTKRIINNLGTLNVTCRLNSKTDIEVATLFLQKSQFFLVARLQLTFPVLNEALDDCPIRNARLFSLFFDR